MPCNRCGSLDAFDSYLCAVCSADVIIAQQEDVMGFVVWKPGVMTIVEEVDQDDLGKADISCRLTDAAIHRMIK